MILYIVIILVVAILCREVYAATHIQAGFYIKAICNTQGGVLLTFDDGPNEDVTPKVLATLKANNVKALFFCIAKDAERHPELIKQIIAEGHIIGQHTYHHNPFNSFRTTSSYLKELELAHNVFKQQEINIRLFRPPLGITNMMIKRAVKKMCYTTIAWSVRSFDTRSEDRNKVLERVKSQLQPNSIILLHDRMPKAEWLAEEIIKEVKQRGWQMASPHDIA